MTTAYQGSQGKCGLAGSQQDRPTGDAETVLAGEPGEVWPTDDAETVGPAAQRGRSRPRLALSPLPFGGDTIVNALKSVFSAFARLAASVNRSADLFDAANEQLEQLGLEDGEDVADVSLSPAMLQKLAHDLQRWVESKEAEEGAVRRRGNSRR